MTFSCDEVDGFRRVFEADSDATFLELHAAILKSRQDHFRNNPVKENRIKKELFKILNDADEVERLFKIVIEQDEY